MVNNYDDTTINTITTQMVIFTHVEYFQHI